MLSIMTRKLASSLTRVSGMTRREWWCVTPDGRSASYSGCTEVLVEGASTANLPRAPSESVIALESPCPSRGDHAMTQDEYVEKLKAQIDQWNAQLKDWEGKAAQAQGRV